MNALAGTMAERIRGAVAPNGVPAPRQDVSERLDGAAYLAAAGDQLSAKYGVKIDDVLDLFVPKNDIVYSAADRGVPVGEFVSTLGSQHCLSEVAGLPADMAGFVRGENEAKIALAEFCIQDPSWTFRDGFAITERDGHALVMAPSVVEVTGGWEFSSYTLPMSRDAFLALDADEKRNVPGGERVYGDIGDIAYGTPELDAAPASMRM